MLTSGPKNRVKQFKLNKLVVVAAGVCVCMLIGAIAVLYNAVEDLNGKQSHLQVKLDEREDEIEQLNSENVAIYEEAEVARQTIEEFKEVEERLNDINLDLPSDTEEDDGSGGPEILENHTNALSDYNLGDNVAAIQHELPELVKDFEQTVNAIVEYEEKLRTVPTYFPAEEGRISSHFGTRSDPFTNETRHHSGTDIAAPLETPVYASADGTVIQASRDGGYGNVIIIDHGETYETLYAHLNSFEAEVGDEVEKGDHIAGMGTTGRSTGVHLHYEVRRNGELVDPYTYMTFHRQDDEVKEDGD